MTIHLVVASDVFDGVLFCAILFPTRCLGRDLFGYSYVHNTSDFFQFIRIEERQRASYVDVKGQYFTVMGTPEMLWLSQTL